MSSSSKRPNTSRPNNPDRLGAKKIKFSSTTFSGSRARFTSRIASAIPQDPQLHSAQPTFHFGPQIREQEPTGPWQAHPTEDIHNWFDEAQPTEGPQFDAEEDLEDVLLGTIPNRGGK
ncbi:hypothetical protein FRC10_007825, partial [Ceratobasidium sp. 414]